MNYIMNDKIINNIKNGVIKNICVLGFSDYTELIVFKDLEKLTLYKNLRLINKLRNKNENNRNTNEENLMANEILHFEQKGVILKKDTLYVSSHKISKSIESIVDIKFLVEIPSIIDYFEY
jgi:hypothetical protein